jgi:hypothetical protein
LSVQSVMPAAVSAIFTMVTDSDHKEDSVAEVGAGDLGAMFAEITDPRDRRSWGTTSSGAANEEPAGGPSTPTRARRR